MKKITRRAWLKCVGGAAAAWPGCGLLAAAGTAAPVAANGAGTLREAMERVGQCCLAWLDPKRGFLPAGGYEVAHDTGRWWDAMLRLEAAAGFTIPPHLETAMRGNFRVLTDNPAGLLANDERLADLKGTGQTNPHNFRESMLSYSGLVRHRGDDWSRRQGLRLVEATERLLEPDGQLDYERLAALVKKPLNPDPAMIHRAPAGQWFDATCSTGRAIEGFLRFYEAAGESRALELAARLAKAHLRQLARPDGKVPPELRERNHVGHNHSYLGTLRGLLLHGLLTDGREYVEAVARTFRQGLFGTVASESGWTPHDLGKSRFANEQGDPVGEHGSCSDLVQLALALGLKAGHPEFLDDAERLIRARLLPSQIHDPATPRQHGAWGVYSHPYGRGCILDVFAAVLQVLTEVYGSIATRRADGSVAVNLHFSAETAAASVEAARAGRGWLRVRLKQAGGLRIRVPGWAPRATLQLTRDGQPLPVRWDGSYVTVAAAGAAPGAAVELQYDLPPRETVETMPVSRREYRLTWRGDEVTGCDPAGPIYPARAVGGSGK